MAYGLTPPMFGETGSANAVWLLQMALFLLSVFIATRQVVFQASRLHARGSEGGRLVWS